jgi:hypothetical protein
MADIQNPDGGGGGGGGVGVGVDAKPDPDDRWPLPVYVACMVGAVIAYSALPLLFYRAHRASGLLVLGVVGFLLAGCCCVFLVLEGCVYGNLGGRLRTDEEELEQPPPPPPPEV